MAYIHCGQKANGVTYASVHESYHDKGRLKTKRIENLGYGKSLLTAFPEAAA